MTRRMRTRRLLGLALGLALGGGRVAAAAPIVAPAGWTSSPPTTPASGLTTQTFMSPNGDVALSVVRAITPRSAAGDPVAIDGTAPPFGGAAGQGQALTIDDLQAGAHADFNAATDVEDEFGEKVVADRRQAEASLRWHGATDHGAAVTRLVVVATASTMVTLAGNCRRATAAPDARDAVFAACTQALATLDPEVAEAQRVPIVLRTATAAAPAVDAAPSPQTVHHAAYADTPQLSHMADGTHVAIPPLAIPPSDTAATAPVDRRPIYIGAGLLLFAMIAWWNRRNRAALDAETREPRAPRPARTPTQEPADDDADSLHAAASETTPDAPAPPSTEVPDDR